MAQIDQLSSVADPVVTVRALTRRFGARAVLDDVDLEIGRGEFVAVLGRSGSGKTTLLRALANLDEAVDGYGKITVPKRKAVVFQDARLLPWARVLDNILLGLSGRTMAARARQLLDEVGLRGREQEWPLNLSGGEQQRVALARALIRAPELLLADEPFGALDALTRLAMHGLLERLCLEYRPAVVLVTHDVDEALLLAGRVIVIGGGRIVLDAPIHLNRPRRHGDPAFLEYRTRLLAVLGVDTTGMR